ncbi:hypothetical protein HYW36_00235 [Candidatus Saccharibacteria bacterium]|nr:hypothetical protein [Candidatus Saccharibacteria bacterium]
MIKNLFSLPRKTLLIILVIIIAVGVLVYTRDNEDKGSKSDYPVYLNFDGNYVFSVPKNYTVDEQSVPGAQLVYTGKIEAKTLEDVYAASGIAIQPITDLTDQTGKAFKKYVNDQYLPEFKKNLSTDDVQVKFGKVGGTDNAAVTAKKDGKQFRFLFLKGGQHPVAVVAKQESAALKDIERTLIDVEKSDLKTEQASIKKLIRDTTQLVKDQKAKDLYSAGSTELKASTTEAELAAALKTATPYTEGNVIISGVSYTPDSFSTVLRLTKLNKDDQQPAIGALTFKKVDGQWKLELLTLPDPTRQ